MGDEKTVIEEKKPPTKIFSKLLVWAIFFVVPLLFYNFDIEKVLESPLLVVYYIIVIVFFFFIFKSDTPKPVEEVQIKETKNDIRVISPKKTTQGLKDRQKEAIIWNLSQSKTQKKLYLEAGEHFRLKQYEQAEIACLAALQTKRDNPIDRHFVYSNLIKSLYKLKDSREGALDECIHYCQRDIELLPVFFSKYSKQYPSDQFYPDCESLERLAIIYEKQGEIQKAIEVCQQAIELGIDKRYEWYNKQYEANKGYAVRKERLEKKLKRKDRQ